MLAIGDALLAIRIDGGSHTIELSYTPKGMFIGIGISVFALAVVILLLFWNRSKGKMPAFLTPYPIRKAVDTGSQTELRPATESMPVESESASPEEETEQQEQKNSDHE